MKKGNWYNKGLKFQCQGSGKCCISRGEYGYVYLDKNDRINMAKFFKLRLGEFTKKYCVSNEGYYRLKTSPHELECLFLKDNKCSIYSARPTQCRTWPFWPEVLQAKTWKKEVAQFCPGVGKGKLYTRKEIEAIAHEQNLSELLMDKEPLPKINT
ncbi:MAG: YkgJ family cysteine cluster protein [Bdellovibrionaceae bacterium]|nr:YkgJ family cysteine cluster protein [Pseudobdellovibrionaceae bacterium]